MMMVIKMVMRVMMITAMVSAGGHYDAQINGACLADEDLFLQSDPWDRHHHHFSHHGDHQFSHHGDHHHII